MERLNARAVGQRIRRSREQRGMLQRELASLGVSYAYVSRIEHGQRRPSLTALAEVAARLGVLPVYLATGRGRSAPAVRQMPTHVTASRAMSYLA